MNVKYDLDLGNISPELAQNIHSQFDALCAQLTEARELAKRFYARWRVSRDINKDLRGRLEDAGSENVELCKGLDVFHAEVIRQRGENEALMETLKKIALTVNCEGPGCWYCKDGDEHPPTFEAIMAYKAIMAQQVAGACADELEAR